MSEARRAVTHHFDNAQQQREAAELGMWVFLATEVLFFGGLFTSYTVYRLQYEQTFAQASHHMDLFWGTVNTAVLLCSSLTMALAVLAAQAGKRKPLVALLSATIVLGSAFLGIKFLEYYHKYQEALIPFPGWPRGGFSQFGAEAGAAKLFFYLYFAMTGLHALHMVIGVGILATLLWIAVRGGLLAERSTPVHISGLYWHFVDIVWVFLFPLLYLVGARG